MKNNEWIDKELNKNFFERVYEKLLLIPKGRVTTYGEIAKAIGNPRMSRQVGFALHCNPKPDIYPCYRVVNRFGQLSSAFAFGGVNKQKELLQDDGIEVVDDRVDLSKYMFRFDDHEL